MKRRVTFGPSVTVDGESYFSNLLWPHMSEEVDVFKESREAVLVKDLYGTVICRAETRTKIRELAEEGTINSGNDFETYNPDNVAPEENFRGYPEMQKQLDRIERRLNAMNIDNVMEEARFFLKRQKHLSVYFEKGNSEHSDSKGLIG